MKILAIESSGMTAGASILEDDTIIAAYEINHKKTHSQTLLPMIDEICRMTQTDRKTLDAVALSSGPGSFTGLRIGGATAMGIGLALDIPLVPVPTLAAYAYNAWGTDKLICPMMDARRKTVYNGLYRFRNGKLITVKEQRVLPVSELVTELNTKWKTREDGSEVTVLFLGDGYRVQQEYIEEALTIAHETAPAHLFTPRSAGVAVLAKQYLEEGKSICAADFSPIYLRMTQAERERLEKEKAAEKAQSHD